MKLHVINPNTSSAMSATLQKVTQYAARSSSVAVLTSTQGPPSLESHVDDALAVPGILLLAHALRHKGATDGVLIACFGDPGIDAVRELCCAPVLGIAEAAMHTAAILGHRFSVVTTLPRTIPTAQRILQRTGLYRQCARVRACALPVNALEDAGACWPVLLAECKQAIAEDDIDTLVLGCAGMADMAEALSDTLGIPVIDGVRAGIQLLEGLAHQQLRPAKLGDRAFPTDKPCMGPYAEILHH